MIEKIDVTLDFWRSELINGVMTVYSSRIFRTAQLQYFGHNFLLRRQIEMIQKSQLQRIRRSTILLLTPRSNSDIVKLEMNEEIK